MKLLGYVVTLFNFVINPQTFPIVSVPGLQSQMNQDRNFLKPLSLFAVSCLFCFGVLIFGFVTAVFGELPR